MNIFNNIIYSICIIYNYNKIICYIYSKLILNLIFLQHIFFLKQFHRIFLHKFEQFLWIRMGQINFVIKRHHFFIIITIHIIKILILFYLNSIEHLTASFHLANLSSLSPSSMEGVNFLPAAHFLFISSLLPKYPVERPAR